MGFWWVVVRWWAFGGGFWWGFGWLVGWLVQVVLWWDVLRYLVAMPIRWHAGLILPRSRGYPLRYVATANGGI